MTDISKMPTVADIASILVVPTEAGRALLAEGPAGSRPPVMWRPWREDYGSPTGGTWAECWVTYDDSGVSPEEGAALVLAHAGKVVPEGCDRLVRAINVARDKWVWRLHTEYAMGDVQSYAQDGVRDGLVSRIVLLDPSGAEVPNAE